MAHKAEIKPKQAKVDGIDIMRPAYTISSERGCWYVSTKNKKIAKLNSKESALRLIDLLKKGRKGE